ncbi:MAG TPA: DUF885 domain-containing protein [Terriglobales bacterium]|nr:DUF885 domain-containing protein [Terriglobales bacterium]
MRLTIAVLMLFLGVAMAHDTSTAGKVDAKHMKAWEQLGDEFLDQLYSFHPTGATADGLHQHDAELEDYSKAGVDAEIAALKQRLAQAEKFSEQGLDAEAQIDRRLMLGYLNNRLLTLEAIRGWEKDPDNYQSGITNSVFVIMARNYAPQEERLKSVIARERKMRAVFAAARANLKNPPRIYTEIALQQTPGLISFFEHDVPLAFDKVKDEKLLAEFKSSNAAVIAALGDYQKWMKEDLLPSSTGDFRIGPENYQKKLLYQEGVDIPLDRLLEIGMANLRANQEWFRKTAAEIDPKGDPQEILKQMQHDHPAPDKLLQAYGDLLDGLRDFIIKNKIMTVPSQQKPAMEETPPFARATTFASMDTPGAFETKATEAFFNVTLPEASWSKEEVEGHMAGNSRPVMLAVAIHEVWPGHFMQYLWMPLFPTKLRKVLGSNTSTEGWAHYTEQMMLDQHVAHDDPKMRLGQLQDALLRNARYIVGIKMHTGDMTYDQAVDFFVKEGYQTKSIAERETKRGTGDPTYLVYTLGKLQIMKLREDYKKKMGDKFTLQGFHDSFMKHGLIPIREVRKLMLGEDSPTL